MIEIIVGEKFIELRNERQLDTDAIRSLCDSVITFSCFGFGYDLTF